MQTLAFLTLFPLYTACLPTFPGAQNEHQALECFGTHSKDPTTTELGVKELDIQFVSLGRVLALGDPSFVLHELESPVQFEFGEGGAAEPEQRVRELLSLDPSSPRFTQEFQVHRS